MNIILMKKKVISILKRAQKKAQKRKYALYVKDDTHNYVFVSNKQYKQLKLFFTPMLWRVASNGTIEEFNTLCEILYNPNIRTSPHLFLDKQIGILLNIASL